MVTFTPLCRADRAAGSLLLVLLMSIQSTFVAAQLAPIESNPTALSAPRHLRLEVLINGISTQYVEPFIWTPPGRLAAARGDLEDVGVKIPGPGRLTDLIDIDRLPGIKFRYDEPTQKINFILSDGQRLARIYDARRNDGKLPKPTAGWGGVVNYTFYGASMARLPAFPTFSGANLTLDARAFSPLGTLSQTAIFGDTVVSHANALRLDSTFTYSDPGSLSTERVGDMISGGLAWTRPIRMGGLQLQRNFTLRSDLVTQPMPVITGSAAVPSTVDVFINNVKAFSQNVQPGPYQFINLPTTATSGTAQVVVTDVSGRQVETSFPFYNSPTLLASGLTDFSFETGFARRSYATLSDDYDRNPIGSATLRGGIYDGLTVESHAEAGDGLINAGVGVLVGLGPWGTLATAGTASRFAGQAGYQGFVSYSAQFRGLTFNASTQRIFGQYSDLAAVTATQPQFSIGGVATTIPFGIAAVASGWDPRPPQVLDQISLGVPLSFVKTSLTASFIHLVDASGTSSQIVSASLTRQLPWSASLYTTVFVDLAQHREAGIFAGFSIPLGADISASVGASSGVGTGSTIATDAQKALQNTDGSYGWRIHDGEGTTPYRAAEASYRSSYGTVDVGAQQQNGGFGGTAQIDGSVALMGGGIFLGNRIHDSFAVVDTGVSDITVLENNRPIGATNPWGKLLVPDLRSYQANNISIDPTGLPSSAEAKTTQKTIVPANQSGVYVNFGVEKDVHAVIVILVGANGKNLPPGSKGQLEGSDETFVVGYDGQAYVKHLASLNTVIAENGETECRASFSYVPARGKRATIGPVTCQ